MTILFENRLKYLYNIDLFAKDPELYYKGKRRRTSWIGFFFTILYFVLYIIIFMYKFIKMIQKTEVSFYETYAYLGDIPSIRITSENFYGGFALGKETPFIDETIYYPKIDYIRRERKNGQVIETKQEIEAKICELNDFGPKYRELFKDKPLNQLYCLKDLDKLNIELSGYNHLDIYSYLNIGVYSCNGTTKNGTQCKTFNETLPTLFSNIFSFYIQDIDLSPQYYHTPVQYGEKIIQGPLYRNLYQKTLGYFQIVNIETDQDFIGLNAFSKSTTEKYLKYEEAWVISAPTEGYTYEKGFPICDITVQLSDKVLTQKRTFVKLIDILGDVGGSMGVILTFFNIITSALTSALYQTSLVNNLFSFDIHRKIIVLKEDKNNKIGNVLKEQSASKSEHSPKNIGKLNEEKINIVNVLNNDQNINSNQLIVNRPIKVPRRKNKTQQIDSIISNFNQSNDTRRLKSHYFSGTNVKNYDINNKNSVTDIGSLNCNKINEEIKENNKYIINKIEINRFYFIICFCCIKKRKTIQNVLLDEAIRIIKKKLDIMNIFKKLLRDEEFPETFKKIIDMSDECKKNLEIYKV